MCATKDLIHSDLPRPALFQLLAYQKCLYKHFPHPTKAAQGLASSVGDQIEYRMPSLI